MISKRLQAKPPPAKGASPQVLIFAEECSIVHLPWFDVLTQGRLQRTTVLGKVYKWPNSCCFFLYS